ncbi:hypothetical protein [Polaromonas sp.]|uniref:hypothetical protein n=1 Tax=Polaromonas sp. TaxID=1869339 RepID=UPI0032650A49
MAKLKSEQHHWWPRCVSRNWAAEDGTTGWIRPDGNIVRVPPHRLGAIGNAHHIKLGHSPGVETSWDSSFEREFDIADNNFPSVISWLEGLERKFIPEVDLRRRFLALSASDDQLRLLTESVVSLAVRSPRNRAASVALAERLRGTLPSHERNALIGVNMCHSQRIITDSFGTRGKYAVLFSEGREFIFGDGFFHNVVAVNTAPLTPKLLVPITPYMSVIVSRPGSFMVEPRLSTLVLDDDEVEKCNHAIQVYSRSSLFFRSQKPTLIEDFMRNEHLVYADPNNPIDNLILSIPGIPPRDHSLHFLMRG